MLGLHDFLERKLAAYNDASEAVRIKLEEKEIERNRPKYNKPVEAEKRPVAPKKTRAPLVLEAIETEELYSDGESARKHHTKESPVKKSAGARTSASPLAQKTAAA